MTEQGTPTQVRSILVNYYMYGNNQSQPSAASKQTPSLVEQLDKISADADRWFNEILPEVQRLTDYYRQKDFDALSDADLIAELEQLREMRVQQGRMHSLATAPWGAGTNLLIDTYNELMGEDELGAVRLVQGYGNKSVEAGFGMWHLSNLARSIATVRNSLENVTADNALEQLKDLEQEPEARQFVEAFSDYLDEYGWRTDLLGFDERTWNEDPTIPLCQLRSYVKMDGYDPDKELDRLVQERNAAIDAVKERLDGDGWDRIEAVLKIATMVSPIQEDHNYYIDQQLTTMPRRLVLATGRRLVSKGVLADPADVFYLYMDEIRSTISGQGSDVKALVNRRQDERAYWSQITPPSSIGVPPSQQATQQLGGRNTRFFGESRLAPDQATLFSGTSGSAGVAQGPARVLMNLSEAERVNKGDILIARTTMPPWTPLFAVANAIVVETGGILSHAAVTAREYGIPAVLGIANATRVIRDGQLIEVDGTNGTVRILT